MDSETAQTLSELERKLGELERELAAVGGGTNGGRVIDEAAEPSSAPPTPASPPLTPPPFAPPPAAPPARPVTHAPQRSAAPDAEELLRFRERLEQTAIDLTRDYDELLGRLSYATVPTSTATPVGPAISFARGAPSLDIVDVEGLREASMRALQSDPGGATAYGTSVGYLKLRAWIAEKHGVAPENVIVTNGSMQADAFLFEQLVGAGDEVVVERPTYDRTLLSLRKRGARVHAVQLQPDGIDTDALARLLEGPAGAQPKLAHVIPNFQNPAGYTLSADQAPGAVGVGRASTGSWCSRTTPMSSCASRASRSRRCSRWTPSGSCTPRRSRRPSARVSASGYLVGPRELIASVAELATNTYISPSMVAQAIVYEFCASGAIERSIETVKAALSERADALAQALRRELPEAEFVPPEGGYFMWVTLPPGTDVATLFKLAAERGVAFVKGTDFLLEGGENTLRLAYSGVTPEQIDEGVARLAAAYRSL